MKSLLQSMLLLACLLTPCQYLSAQTHNPYDAEVNELAQRLSSAEQLQQLVLLDQICRLRDYVDDRAQITAILQRAAGDPTINAVVRAEANALSAELSSQTLPPPTARRWYQDEIARKQILLRAAQLSRNGSADAAETLAELEFLAGIPDAAEHMERAASLSPTANRWQRAAFFTTDQFRKFADLQAALAIEPANAGASLQLSAYYIGRNQLEQARDLLMRAFSASPQNFVVRERLAELYLSLGLRSEALREFKSLQQEWPAPLWLKSRLAINYEQLGLREEAAQLASSVLAEEKDDRELLELLTRFHEVRHMRRELKQDYLALSRLEPKNTQLWQKLARLQMDSGDFEGARASQRELADATRSLPAHSETNVALSADANFLADPARLAKAAFSDESRDSDIALADIRVQELYPNGLDRVHVQQIYFVNSDLALENHRLISIQYSPASQELHLLHARAWKASGQTLDAQDLGDRQPGNSLSSMYYDRRTRQLRFAKLERGDVVEIEYSLTPVLASNPYGRYFGELVFFATHEATNLKRYVLIAPAADTIYTHAEKLPAATVLTRSNSKIFVWEARQVPAFLREPRSPGMSEIAPYVHVSTFADWRQLGAWYADLVRPQFKLDSPLELELKRLLQGKHNDREKIAAIQDFILRGTHYVAQEFGVYSYKPYPVSQTYARRFGDCKDKASLMIALLRAAGIEAQLALVRTRSLGAVVPQPASVALFDHAIVYIPQYDLWLDATAEYAVRELPLEDQDALALTVSLDGEAQLRQTPLSRAGDNYTKHTIKAELTSQGVIRFSGSTTARGEDAPGLRQELSIREQQLDSVRRDLAQIFPTVQVYKVNVRGQQPISEEEAGEISVEFRGDLHSIRQKRIISLSSSWIPRSYASALAPSEYRTEDLMLFAPWITEEEIHIALPPGVRVTELPRDRTITTAFGSLKLHYKKQPDALLVQSRVQFNKARVTAAEYPAFRDFCVRVGHSFAEPIKVELP